ncbi:MAG TPA: neutral/alkaline non-lysosomal ceramidase N-terminal domain-containing protein [Chryseosolibacter sp.]
MAKRILRKFFFGLLILVGLLLVFLLAAIGLVDYTPAADFEGYKETFNEVKKITVPGNDSISGFSVGYSKVNLTPSGPVALAGYGNRKGKHYSKVADSIFVRTLVIANGTKKVAIVSADLLLIPPRVSKALEEQLPSIGYNVQDVFLGATHTHNSIGNWGEGAAGFLYGPYEESMIQFITSKIITSILMAGEHLVEGKLRFGKIANDTAVDNRLIEGGLEDPYLRMLEVTRNDSTKLLLATYSAHATCLYSRDLELSRDYPGKFVDDLEESGYEFAMFMAGAVGSHKPGAPEFGWTCFDWMADELVASVRESKGTFKTVKGSALAGLRLPLHLSDPQVKVTPDLKVRSWLFRSALGEYPVYITGLKIGDVALLGVPADFSGEFMPHLDSISSLQNQRLLVTSFNGGYIGYLTPQKHYDNKYFETQFMNWYAPGTGEFVRDVMCDALNKMSNNQ